MSQVFSFHNHPVRTIIENGQPWFVGKDIATLLGYTKTDKEIRRICKHVKLFKGSLLVPLNTPPRGLLIIPESDVWRLVIRSNMAKAQEVEEWIMGEVLPTIRETGGYQSGRRQAAIPEAKPVPPKLPHCYDNPGCIEAKVNIIQEQLFQKTVAFMKDMQGLSEQARESYSHGERISNVGTVFDVFAYDQCRIISSLAEQAYQCGAIALRQMDSMKTFAPHLKKIFG